MDNTQRKTKNARLIGASFFLLLALTYVGFEIYYGLLSWFDVVLIALASTPIVTSKRMVSFLFGCFTFCVTGFVGFGFVLAHERYSQTPAAIPAEGWMFALGYSLIFLSFCASLLLIYASVNISEKRFSLP